MATVSTYQILDDYNSLSCSEKLSVMSSALDYMESYNGRSRITCICLAMGYRNETGDSNDWYKESEN